MTSLPPKHGKQTCHQKVPSSRGPMEKQQVLMASAGDMKLWGIVEEKLMGCAAHLYLQSSLKGLTSIHTEQ